MTEIKPCPDMGDKIEKAIFEYLRHGRLNGMMDDLGQGYPIIDAFTPDNKSVQIGIDECEYLANMLAGEVMEIVRHTPASPDAVREALDIISKSYCGREGNKPDDVVLRLKRDEYFNLIAALKAQLGE